MDYDKRNYHVMALNVYFIQPSKMQNRVMWNIKIYTWLDNTKHKRSENSNKKIPSPQIVISCLAAWDLKYKVNCK